MTVEDWLVLTNRADIDEKEMVRKISGKEMTGVLQSSGDIWHQQRRFTLRALRDFLVWHS